MVCRRMRHTLRARSHAKMAWFREMFGFAEDDFSFDEVRKRFEYDGRTGDMRSKENNASFHAGWFSTPSVAHLQKRLLESAPTDLGGATYSTVEASVAILHEVRFLCLPWCSCAVICLCFPFQGPKERQRNFPSGEPVQLFGNVRCQPCMTFLSLAKS